MGPVAKEGEGRLENQGVLTLSDTGGPGTKVSIQGIHKRLHDLLHTYHSTCLGTASFPFSDEDLVGQCVREVCSCGPAAIFAVTYDVCERGKDSEEYKTFTVAAVVDIRRKGLPLRTLKFERKHSEARDMALLHPRGVGREEGDGPLVMADRRLFKFFGEVLKSSEAAIDFSPKHCVLTLWSFLLQEWVERDLQRELLGEVGIAGAKVALRFDPSPVSPNHEVIVAAVAEGESKRKNFCSVYALKLPEEILRMGGRK